MYMRKMLMSINLIGNHLSKLINFLSDELDFSTFPHKTGNHIEHRPGGINFSVLGRGEDSMKHRKEYVKMGY